MILLLWGSKGQLQMPDEDDGMVDGAAKQDGEDTEKATPEEGDDSEAM
jgi:hypothetical protein